MQARDLLVLEFCASETLLVTGGEVQKGRGMRQRVRKSSFAISSLLPFCKMNHKARRIASTRTRTPFTPSRPLRAHHDRQWR